MIPHGKPPRLTAELFTIPLDNEKYVIYAPLRQAAFVTNAETVNVLAEFRDGGAGSLDVHGGMYELLRHLGIIDGGEERRPSQSHSGLPKPTSLTLFLTTACNLRCSYCYASAGDTPLKRMPIEVAKRGIDFVTANAVELNSDEIEINYHGGGEPSVNWLTLTQSYDYACEKASAADLTVSASMASNGVLDDKRLDWILANINGVSLSFDGLPEVHDAHRPMVGGGPSSSRVIHTLRRFDAEAYNYGVRMTVTRDQIAMMADSVQFLCENFCPQRVQVEPAYQLGRWRNEPSAETEAFITGFRTAREVARQYGFDLEFSAARIGTITNHFCGVTQDSFCLTADGAVSSCYEVFLEDSEFADIFHYGRFEESEQTYTFNLPVLNNLRERTVDNRSFCDGCFAKWTCGGDCHHKALSVNGGERTFSGTERCHVIRELTKDQILERIAAFGGLFWKEDPVDQWEESVAEAS